MRVGEPLADKVEERLRGSAWDNVVRTIGWNHARFGVQAVVHAVVWRSVWDCVWWEIRKGDGSA